MIRQRTSLDMRLCSSVSATPEYDALALFDIMQTLAPESHLEHVKAQKSITHTDRFSSDHTASLT